MTKLFVGSIIVWSSYTVAVIIGSMVTNLIGVPTTFASIWTVMLILVISALIADSFRVVREEKARRDEEEDHSESV